MATTITTFRTNDITSQIIEGLVFNGIATLTFASGETEKQILLEIPLDKTLQYQTQALTMTPYDNTLTIRLMEGVTTLTAGTPVIVRNLNRNFTDVPVSTFTTAPVGVYGGEGTVIEDFTPYIREQNYPVASKTIKAGLERILKHDTHYLFRFIRTTDTAVLTLEFRWIWFVS